MASTNQSPQYQKAEAKFLSAQTPEERIEALKEMIKECPKHKSSEKMLANLKTRLKKFQEQLEKSKKISRSRSGKKGIKKEDLQAIIVGLTNSGKSSLLFALTNTLPKIDSYEFTTKTPNVGMLNYNGINIQLIENPAINSEYHDRGLTNSADTLLIIVNELIQINEIEKFLTHSHGKKIIVFNNFDKTHEELRKIDATLKSKKYNYVIVNLDFPETNGKLNELKEKLFQSFGKIRVFTKEPGKEKSPKPVILEPESTVKNIAEKILKGFSNKVVQTKLWGPSSKFPGQIVGLNHVLKDLDVVEFKTR